MKNSPPLFGSKGPGARVVLEPKGYSYKWGKIRKAQLNSNPLCQQCQTLNLVTPAKEVDHIIPKAMGGPDTLENAQSLCIPCHKAKTKADIQAMKGMW